MKHIYIGLGALLFSSALAAASLEVEVFATHNAGKSVGTVVFEDTDNGLLIKPNLTELPPGLHGFHVHKMADCGEHGMEAGGHYDPDNTGTHQGPYGKGHLGDLPALYVNKKGKANHPTLAPRPKVKDLYSRALMVHGGGDNYSDTPKLGGGGKRIACGAIKKPTGKKS